MQYTHKKQFGFTLIELLIVIGILGVLLALAIPSLGSYQRNVNVKNAAKDLRSLLWEAQGYGLAPQDTQVERYRVAVTNASGQLDPRVQITKLKSDCTPVTPGDTAQDIVKDITLSKIFIEQIKSDKVANQFSSRLAIDFAVGNVDGGKVSVVDLTGNPANCVPLVNTGKISIILASPTADQRYRVVINPGNNTIDYAKE